MDFSIQENRRWQPVHTKPRCEKKFHSFCEKYSIDSYLPLRLRLNTVRKKVMRSMVPMFPGYAFACLDSDQKYRITQTNSVVSFIKLNKVQEAALLEDLRSIVLLEQMQDDGGLVVSPEINPGSEVCIKSGPLRGVMGIVEKRKGVHRVIVNVEMISQSVSMELDASDIELEA